MSNYGFTINVDGNAMAKMAEIEKELEKFGAKVQTVTHNAHNNFSKLGEGVKEHASFFKEMFAGAIGIGGLFAAGALIEKSVEHVNHLNKASADLHQTLLTMSGAAGVSEGELHEFAESLEKLTGIEKSTTIQAEAMLATFGNIKGEQFKSAISSAADYAIKFFNGDMVEASKSLGIALDDPIKGISRLHRQGVSFSETQKENIKHLQEQGKLMEAQEIILKEIKRETGGQAEAYAKTDEGKLQLAKTQWDGIYERIGNIVNSMKIGLIPLIGKITSGAEAVLDFFSSSSTAAVVFRDIILAIAAGFGVYYTVIGAVALATKIATAAQWLWNAAMWANPIGIIIALIIALIAGVMYLWDKFKGFREFLGGFFGFISEGFKIVWDLITNVAKIIKDIFTGNWGAIAGDFKEGAMKFAEHFKTGIKNAIIDGAKEAGESTFKFGDLLKLPGSDQKGPSSGFGIGGKGNSLGGNGITNNAMNTSKLSGASGGLGEAKVVNIRIDTVQKNIGVKESAEMADSAAEQILRTINNIGYSASSTQ